MMYKFGKSEDPILKAIRFAQEKHRGQVRKFSGKPYFIHPDKVAKLVYKYTKSPFLQVAAYLHDTLEDTNTTYQEIQKEFSTKIADVVTELTSIEKEKKKLGKHIYLARKMNKMSSDALTIKLCDRLDNISDKSSLEFRKKYKKETEYIINNLKRPLNGIQKRILKDIKKVLEKMVP